MSPAAPDSPVRRSRGENGALDALHERLGSRGSLYRPLLQVVNFLKLLLNPRVPEVEGNFLLLTLCIQLAGGHREYKVRVLLIVDNFQGQATLQARSETQSGGIREKKERIVKLLHQLEHHLYKSCLMTSGNFEHALTSLKYSSSGSLRASASHFWLIVLAEF